MNSIVFRSYDIRGKIGEELNLDEIYNLGSAIASYFINQEPKVSSIALGCDARFSSEHIKKELTQAFIDSGITVTFIGVVPTPALYFSLNILPVQAGIMVTASHNKAEYNGIKIYLNKNSAIALNINQIKEFYIQKIFPKKLLVPGIYQEYNIITKYVNWLVDKFQHLKLLDDNLVIDCLSGTSAIVMPLIAEKLQWKNTKFINTELDPLFSKFDPDPTVEANLLYLKPFITKPTDLGIAFDGDSDRMSVLTSEGLLSGDILISLFSWDILQTYPNAGILADIKSSKAVEKLVELWGGSYYSSPSGHSLIRELISKNESIIFAGEISCHFFFRDRYFGYDDGIYASLRLIELINKYKKPISQLINWYPKIYTSKEFRIQYDPACYDNLVNQTTQFFGAKKDASVNITDGVKATLPYGWGLLRKSNTESVLSLRFESETKKGLKQITEEFYGILENYIDTTTLSEIKN